MLLIDGSDQICYFSKSAILDLVNRRGLFRSCRCYFSCLAPRGRGFLRQRSNPPLIISCKNSGNSEALPEKGQLAFEMRTDPGHASGGLCN
jgi:hypothetical protein